MAGGGKKEDQLSLAIQKVQRPSEGSDFPGRKEDQTPELGEASQKKDPDYLKEDNHEGHPKTSGLTEKPGVEPSKEDDKDAEKLGGPGKPRGLLLRTMTMTRSPGLHMPPCSLRRVSIQRTCP